MTKFILLDSLLHEVTAWEIQIANKGGANKGGGGERGGGRRNGMSRRRKC